MVTNALCSCWSFEADRREKVFAVVAVTVVVAVAVACVAAVDARFLRR